MVGGGLSGNSGKPTATGKHSPNTLLGAALTEIADDGSNCRCVNGKDDLLKFKLGTIMRETDKLMVLMVQCIKSGLIYDFHVGVGATDDKQTINQFY